MNQAYTLGNDSELRLPALDCSGPARKVASPPSTRILHRRDRRQRRRRGQAWPLNSAVYAEGNVVYVLQASAPDSGVIIRRKSADRSASAQPRPRPPSTCAAPCTAPAPLGWKHSKANVAHNTPAAIAKYTLSGNTASAVLVSIVAGGTGIWRPSSFR